MALRGDFHTMTPAELLQFLALGDKSGVLEVWSDDATVRVLFDIGKIVASASTGEQYDLGSFLVRNGYLTQEEVDRATAAKEQLEMSLAEILLALRFVSKEKELAQLVRMKIETEIIEMFRWKHAEFLFEAKSFHDRTFPLRIDPVGVVMEAGRQLDEGRRDDGEGDFDFENDDLWKASSF